MIWRAYYQTLGAHVHVRIFCGPVEGALGQCGKLVMRSHEFTEFTKLRRCMAMDFRSEKVGDAAVFADLNRM